MDQNSKSHQQHPLGVNKFGKSIRKSPLHQPNFPKLQTPPPPTPASLPPPPPQPQVFNVDKSDFRSIVQQLTGSPARDPAGAVNIPAQARLPQTKTPSSRLMKIRPPPLTPISRPPPPPMQNSAPNQNPYPNLNPNPGFHPRPAPLPTAHIGATWADSPVSAYMRYLESSLLTSDTTRRTPAQGFQPLAAPLFSPRGNPPPVGSVPVSMQPGLLPSPGPQFPQLSPRSQLPLPSPNSLLPLPSPSSFLNLLSPKSPYSLLSPGFQYPQHFIPNFSFSSMPQSGILGPGPGSQPPPSPSLLFPPSPSGFLPLLSPRWREM